MSDKEKELDDTLYNLTDRQLLMVIKVALLLEDQSSLGIGMKALDVLVDRVDNVEPLQVCGTWVD